MACRAGEPGRGFRTEAVTRCRRCRPRGRGSTRPSVPGSGAAGPGGVETSGGWLAAPAVSRRRPRAPLLFPRGVGRPRC